MPKEAHTANERSVRLIVGAVCLFLYLPFLYLYGFKYSFIPHVDFPSFYWGAEVALHEQRSPYGADAFSGAETDLEQIVFPYLYPPPSLLLFWPFTLTDYESAKLAMLRINHVTVLLLAWLLLARLARLDVRTTVGAALFLFFVTYFLGFLPIATNLNHGQVNLIALLLVCLSWLALRERRRPALVGLPLGVAMLLKTYPVLFLALLVFKRQFRALGWALGAVLAATAVAYGTLPGAAWSDWFTHVLPTGGYGALPYGLFSPATPHNQSINGFALRLFSSNEFTPTVHPAPEVARLFAYALSGLVAGTTLLLNFLARHRRDLLDLEFSLLLLMMFLVGPLSWDHHVVFALPAVVIVMLHLWWLGRVTLLGAIALPSAFLLAWHNPYFFNSLAHHTTLYVLAMSMKFYAAMAYWALGSGLLAWYLWRGRTAISEHDLRRAQLHVLPGHGARR